MMNNSQTLNLDVDNDEENFGFHLLDEIHEFLNKENRCF
jgi:hypothetical protein